MSRIWQFIRGPAIHQFFANGRWHTYQSGVLEAVAESCVGQSLKLFTAQILVKNRSFGQKMKFW